MIDLDNWLKRADEVITQTSQWNYAEALQFATSMITQFYGPDSPQMRTFRATMEAAQKSKSAFPEILMSEQAKATIKNITAEIQAGLIKSVRALLAGEIISELISLAKELLADSSDSAKNVSAVLVAAAFEDTMRRMGSDLAGITGRPALQDLVIALKEKGLLRGGEPAIAQSYLRFRNDSLHADWSKVERSQVHSCLAFVEQLLSKHFS